jgi:hypothetical protein
MKSLPNLSNERDSITSEPTRLGIDWIVYLGIVCCRLINIFSGGMPANSDTVAYLDLSDAIKGGLWHSVVNAYWFPVYPALFTLGRAIFGFRQQYEIMAVRMVECGVELLMILASVLLAIACRRLMLARNVRAAELIPQRIVNLWVAIFAYYFVSLDLADCRPDAIVSALMVLTVAALLLAIAENRLVVYVAVGLLGGLAYWTKAFAFPFFFLTILIAALTQFKKPKVLLRLAVSLAVFVLVAAPLIYLLSASKGHFSYGESGKLNVAWYVNGASRLNPVADLTVYPMGTAVGTFKHPSDLLLKSPLITYNGGGKVFGTLPKWDDPSYWSDGLAPRFVLSQTLLRTGKSLAILPKYFLMRFEGVILVLALCWWGFALRKRSLADPVLVGVAILAVACIGLYATVLLEKRYFVFSLVMLGTLFAACSVRGASTQDTGTLHKAVLLMGFLLLISGLQISLHDLTLAKDEGDNPLKGDYKMAITTAGAEISMLYPRGSELACMGDRACESDTYLAMLAGDTVTAAIETGDGVETRKNLEESCMKMDQSPEALKVLREHHVRAVFADFEGVPVCSTKWLPLGKSGKILYLPL